MTGNSHRASVSHLHLKYFRAIDQASITLGEVVALVGQNGGGKTSILRALNSFFNFEAERAAFEEGRHRFGPKTQSVIDVAMAGLKGSGIRGVSTDGSLRARLKFLRKPVWEIFEDGAWQKLATASDVQRFHESLRGHISYMLVPTRRDHEVAHTSSGLVETAVQAWMASHSQRDTKSPKIAQLADQLRTQSLSGLEKALRKIAPLDGPFTFELGHSSSPDVRVLLHNLQLTVREGGQAISLDEAGSGTQSMAVYALYSYLAEVEGRNYILGLEEPEQNLHPQAQQQLVRQLRQAGLQVVFTTHSPTIVDMLDHEHVVLCRRTSSRRRALQVRVTQISQSFFADHGLSRDNYYNFHRRRNSDFLFADYVVVTEGPHDAAVVRRLLEDVGAPPEETGTSLVSLDGVRGQSLAFMFHLLRELDIPAAFVVDRDYFLKYQAPERKDSLDAHGFPRYLAQANDDCVLKYLEPKKAERDRLTELMRSQPRKAMAQLSEQGFFMFMWALEVDLVNGNSTRARMFDFLGIDPARRTTEELLKSKGNRIKKSDVLLDAIAGVSPRALPTSYVTLRRELPIRARAARNR